MMPSLPTITLNFPNYISSVNLISDLRLVNTANEIAGRNIVVDGGTVSGDGAGGVFVWNPASSAADDGVTCVAPSGGGTGRWLIITRNATVVIPPPIDSQRSVTTRTQLASLDVSIGKRVAVAAELSIFDWTLGNFTAQVAADPTHLVYQPHATIPTTTGCWVCNSPAIASTKVDQARNIATSGLVSGGGNLTADRTISVNKASAAECLAGTLDDRAVTPFGLRSLIPFAPTGYLASTNGFATLPGGIIFQWGQVRGTYPEGIITTTFPIVFPNNLFMVTPVVFNPTGGTTTISDTWAQSYTHTTSSFATVIQSASGGTTAGGFDWFAIGN